MNTNIHTPIQTYSSPITKRQGKLQSKSLVQNGSLRLTYSYTHKIPICNFRTMNNNDAYDELNRAMEVQTQIYKNMLNAEIDKEERHELRTKLRKAIVKGRLKNAVIVLHRQAETICSCHDFLQNSRITTAKEISSLAILAKSWQIVRKIFMDERIMRVRHIHVMEAYS